MLKSFASSVVIAMTQMLWIWRRHCLTWFEVGQCSRKRILT